MAAGRGKYICQSQSLNLFMESPEYSKITSMHFYSWQKGLKTGQYLRTKPRLKHNNLQLNLNLKMKQLMNNPVQKNLLFCTRDNPDCLACGS